MTAHRCLRIVTYMTARTRVVVADDHEIMRHGLREILAAIEGVDVVGEACTGEEAVALAADRAPDLVIVDLLMPGMGGIEATRRIHSHRCRVIALSVQDDAATVIEALRAGASGYLPKTACAEELATAVKRVASGDTYVSPLVAGRALGSIVRSDERFPAGVTPREREVLELLAKGLAARSVASRLRISERTVNTHVTNLYRRLGVTNRVDAVRKGMRLGFVRAEG